MTSIPKMIHIIANRGFDIVIPTLFSPLSTYSAIDIFSKNDSQSQAS